MHPKIVATHSSPFKIAGVRDLLERIAALDGVERVIPGRMRNIGGNAGIRLSDAGMAAGQSGRKYLVVSNGVSLELFVVAAADQRTPVEAALAAFPEYRAVGNTRRAAEQAAATARDARIAAARQRYVQRGQRPSDPPTTR